MTSVPAVATLAAADEQTRRKPKGGSAGITDSLAGLIGPYLAFGIPFEVLVLQSFIRRIPDEIIEAARIDGAGAWRIFLQRWIVGGLTAGASKG